MGLAAGIIEGHRRLARRRAATVALLGVLMAVSLLADLLTGPSGVSAADLRGALTGAPETAPALRVIVWQVRLPAALLALLVGAALSLAGAEMQTILDNPLASPFTLGVSSAAAFGAALAIVLGLGLPFLPPHLAVVANAFLFAFASVLFLQFLARGRGSDVATLVLFGIALVFTFNALVALVQLVASPDSLQQLVFWGMGSLAEADWPPVAILGGAVAAIVPFSLLSAWRMTALRLGDERARSYGVDVARLRFFSLLRASLLAATAVAFVGTIGFVGLVGPHIARLLTGEDHRFFLPASLLTGALVMSLASILSKALVPGLLLPVGIVTSLVGLPVFILLIHRSRRPQA
ncbi:FecCD family ABC transporter permease [Shinella sp. BYT-45]|uniref:FecCD family ABC transporter permease n=1 Tax=Shinella sp. BYT-45 TaxID=3377377 RepID=UPI0039817227